MEHFKQMQADIKEFSMIKADPGRETKILSNIKTGLADYLHANMLKFKYIKSVSSLLPVTNKVIIVL